MSNNSDKLISNLSYTNLDFQKIWPEIIETVNSLSKKWHPDKTNESDPGVLLLKEIAIAQDKNNYYIDKNILENYPISMTQQSSANSLYPLLGYNPSYYQSATTYLTFQWIDKTSYNRSEMNNDQLNEIPEVVTVPRGTMFCDEKKEHIFTLENDVLLKTDGSYSTGLVKQGILNSVNLFNQNTIDISNIDNENRLYLPNINVAANGIYITSKDSMAIERKWQLVDNIFLHKPGSFVYELKLDIYSNMPYIQFPDDIENIIGEGLKIEYLITDGYNGNIGPNSIKYLYSNTNYMDNSTPSQPREFKVASIDSTDNSGANLSVNNYIAALNGADPEDLDQAYKNYKKTVGTFDTLVTTLDYFNRLYLSGKDIGISNLVVSDKNTDIQYSYDLIKNIKGIAGKIKEVMKDSKNSFISPFSLKFYCLQYNDDLGYEESKYPRLEDYTTAYNNNYRLSNSNEVSPVLVNEVQQNKCISNTSTKLYCERPCLVLNEFDVNCKLICNKKLTPIQKKELEIKIYTTLYEKYNSREFEFGQQVSYQDMYNDILSCDPVIKYVILDNFEYNTKFPFYHLKNKKAQDESLPYGFLSYADQIASSNEVQYINDYDGFVSKDEHFKKNNSSSVLVFKPCVYYKKEAQNYIILKEEPLDWNTNYNDYYEAILPDFESEIIARSILGGVTPYFINNTKYTTYNFNQAHNEEDTESLVDGDIIEATTEIGFPVATDINGNVKFENGLLEYTVKENEIINIATQSYITSESYGAYVKYEFYCVDHKSSIPKNIEYTLKAGEYLTLFFLVDSSDNKSDYYYYKYGPGTTVLSSRKIDSKDETIKKIISNNFIIGAKCIAPTDSLESIRKIYDEVLLSNDSIDVITPNIVTLQPKTKCYWITNSKDKEYYYLFKDTEALAYTLKQNEYVMYTDAEETFLAVVGSGTEIIRDSIDTEYKVKVSITVTDIFNKGLEAFQPDTWVKLPAKLSLSEKDIISLGEGSKLMLQAIDDLGLNVQVLNTSIYGNNVEAFQTAYYCRSESDPEPAEPATYITDNTGNLNVWTTKKPTNVPGDAIMYLSITSKIAGVWNYITTEAWDASKHIINTNTKELYEDNWYYYDVSTNQWMNKQDNIIAIYEPSSTDVSISDLNKYLLTITDRDTYNVLPTYYFKDIDTKQKKLDYFNNKEYRNLMQNFIVGYTTVNGETQQLSYGPEVKDKYKIYTSSVINTTSTTLDIGQSYTINNQDSESIIESKLVPISSLVSPAGNFEYNLIKLASNVEDESLNSYIFKETTDIDKLNLTWWYIDYTSNPMLKKSVNSDIESYYFNYNATPTETVGIANIKLNKGTYFLPLFLSADKDSSYEIKVGETCTYYSGEALGNVSVQKDNYTWLPIVFTVSADESRIFSIKNISSETTNVTGVIYPMYKVSLNTILNDKKEFIIRWIKYLDSNNEFDPTFIWNQDNNIENPLDAKTFFDERHIFNKYTLPKIKNINVEVIDINE